MADSKLESALINLFRNGGNMNVSQTTAQLHTDKAMRLYNTPKVKTAMLQLEKDGVLKRETSGGITRFSWNGTNDSETYACPDGKACKDAACVAENAKRAVKRFSKAGEPTKRTVAEAIERMRIELQIAYGNDYTFVVLDNNDRVIAAHRHGHDHQTFIACTNNKMEG